MHHVWHRCGCTGTAGASGKTVDPSWFFEQGKHRPSVYHSYILRSHLRLGRPLEGRLNWRDHRSDQRSKMLSEFLRPAEALLRRRAAEWDALPAQSAPSLLFAQGWLYTEEYSGIILLDLALTGGSVLAVLTVLARPRTWCTPTPCTFH